jgi:putative copper export protein
MIMIFVSWLIRYGHVLGAAIWVGGYALLAFCVIPLLGKEGNEILVRLAITVVRVLTYIGTLTMGFGIVLITRTRGFDNFFGSAWGGLIIMGFIIAIILLGIGDGALRPAILRSNQRGIGPARRWAIIGFVLTVLAVGVMTGATFVG